VSGGADVVDLRVDASVLRDVSSRIVTAVRTVPFGRALAAPDGGVLGSPEVAAALEDGAMQQQTRAQTASHSLHGVGSTPATAADSFHAVDTSLAAGAQ
jgi:hypothetical protein